MKTYLMFCLCAVSISWISAQEIIELPHNEIPNVQWENQEKAYYSEDWDNPVVTNVSKPTMQVFRPTNPNGVSVVVAPGGGLYALSIESEGTQVGEWLAERGVTAFVLKYRLVPTGEDGVKDLGKDGDQVVTKVKKVLPHSIQDARNAIAYARENADRYGLDVDKIGMMGFSAGGAVTMGTAYGYDESNQPNFLVPVYAWTDVMDINPAPEDSAPIFIVCSTDDPLGLATGSIDIYNAWIGQEKSAALQMYAKGGHGYGMKKQGLPSDHWIERFHEWLIAQDFLEK